MKPLKIAAAALAMALAGTALGEDIRVQTRLDNAGIQYDVDEDGDYRMIIELEGGRTQIVFVNGDTHEVRGMEIREVWSVAMRADSIPPAVTREMLLRNARYVLGAWNIAPMGGREHLVFAIQLNALTPADDLAQAILIAAAAADEVELELLGSDEF